MFGKQLGKQKVAGWCLGRTSEEAEMTWGFEGWIGVDTPAGTFHEEEGTQPVQT